MRPPYRNDRQAVGCPPGVPEIATRTEFDYQGMPVMLSGVLPVLEADGSTTHVRQWNGIVYVSVQLDAQIRARHAAYLATVGRS